MFSPVMHQWPKIFPFSTLSPPPPPPTPTGEKNLGCYPHGRIRLQLLHTSHAYSRWEEEERVSVEWVEGMFFQLVLSLYSRKNALPEVSAYLFRP